jgi:P-type Mg2+ transporter
MKVAGESGEVSGPHREGAGDPANGELAPEEIWKAPADRLLIRLATTLTGLDTAEVQLRLKTFGPNDAATVKRSPLWLQFLARFQNPLVIILLVASGLSAATGDIVSFIIVVSIVMISITLDFVQEVRAQNTVEALRRSVAVQTTVRRDHASLSVPIDQLVPGDIVELIAGGLVPADSRLLESRDLFINQALLTGEPYPAEKQASDAAFGCRKPRWSVERRICRHLRDQRHRNDHRLPIRRQNGTRPSGDEACGKTASHRFCGRRSPLRHADHAPHRVIGALRPSGEHLVSSASA